MLVATPLEASGLTALALRMPADNTNYLHDAPRCILCAGLRFGKVGLTRKFRAV